MGPSVTIPADNSFQLVLKPEFDTKYRTLMKTGYAGFHLCTIIPILVANVLEAKVCQEEANMVDDGSSELWHKRLAHMSSKGMEILLKKSFLPDVVGINLKSCVDCLAAKQHRVAFHTRSPSKRKNTLDLVQTYVYSMDLRSLGGTQYFVTFIDDHSRKVWDFVLKTKDKVLQLFQQFRARVERETSKKLTV